MSNVRSDLLFVMDILESINLIGSYLDSMTFDDFIKSTEKQDSIIRRLEIIGEASKKVNPAVKQEFTSIPWKQMAGLRDVAIHDYFRIEPEIIWRTATQNLPAIKPELERLKDSLHSARAE